MEKKFCFFAYHYVFLPHFAYFYLTLPIPPRLRTILCLSVFDRLRLSRLGQPAESSAQSRNIGKVGMRSLSCFFNGFLVPAGILTSAQSGELMRSNKTSM